ncbi:O-antigen ligase family protein [Jannaschia sp. LMIT008]|uniref:O-antigen ligase family protein n=1 Tax=Jannaschia maritima TaxID=3032585 RepID=UPI0028125045|nr:O-antigen ligase family protein [Jannaschia sp. LMIT008]
MHPLRVAPIWLGAGGLGGAAAVAAGAVGPSIAALALPVALIGAVVLFAQPFLGVLALVVFSHLDAVEKLVFGFLPVSAFKLIAAGTAVIIALKGMQTKDRMTLALREPVVVCGLLTLCAAQISAVFADDRGLALDALRTFASLLMLMVLIVVTADTRTRVAILIYAVAATSLVSAAILLLETATGATLVAQSEAATTARTAEGFDRSSGGSDYNPTTAASMLLAGVVFALVHMLESARYRRIMAAIVIVGTLAIILSFARSAVVAYALIALLLVWRYRRERFVPLGLVVAAIGIVGFLPFIPAEYWERLGSIFGGGTGRDWTLGRRLTYNLIGLDLIAQNPLLGVGPGNFVHHFVDPAYRFLPGRTLLGRELHNMYLSVIVQLGLGALWFFAIFGYAFARLRAVARAPAGDAFRTLALALGYGFAAYLVASLFLPNEYTKYTWALPALCAALYHVNEAERMAGPGGAP